MDSSPAAVQKKIYSPCSYKLTEVQLYMSTLYQTGSRVIRALSDVEKPFFIFGFGGEKPLLFSGLAVKAAKSENNKISLSTSEKAQISSRVNKFY